MPQEFQVLRCVNCEKFQAHHTKKAKKWICKVCGEKQSYIRIYFTGPARQCRSIVQENNFEAGERKTAKILAESPNYFPRNNYAEQDELDDEQISYSRAAKKLKSEMDGSETTENDNSFWEDDSFFNESCATDECYNQENKNEEITEKLDSKYKSPATVRSNSNELASIKCDKNGSHLQVEVLQLRPENLDLTHKQPIMGTSSNELDYVTYDKNESHLKLEVPKIKPHFVKNKGFQKILHAAEKLN